MEMLRKLKKLAFIWIIWQKEIIIQNFWDKKNMVLNFPDKNFLLFFLIYNL